jgi:hypothetical protein
LQRRDLAGARLRLLLRLLLQLLQGLLLLSVVLL